VVEEGRVLERNMRHSHISREDLMESLRLRGVERVEDVKCAYKERNGEISVIRRAPASGSGG